MNTSASTAVRRDPGWTTRARRDLAIVVLASLVAALLCIKLNVSEVLLSWTRPHERFQLDELPAVLLVLAACLSWFSARRFGEARRELALRRSAEERLSAALSENRGLAQQYVEVQESEHRALARDLHDELGQYLNAIKLDAVSLRARLADSDPPACEQVLAMISALDRVQGVVLGLIHQLRPVGLDELGLTAAMEHCIADWRRRLPNTSIALVATENLDTLDERPALALYRLVQEALTNVARHAHATRVEIRISAEGYGPQASRHINVQIRDDGVGADPARQRTGLGLVGMRERVEALGGSLVVSSTSGTGFTLIAQIPAASS